MKALSICAVLIGGCLQLNGIQIEHAATLRDITVNRTGHDLNVEITATVPVIPRIETVSDPDRLIIDMPEVLPSAVLHKIAVNRGQLKDIRVTLLSATPRITRIVLDLMGTTTPYRLSAMGKKLLVKFADESAPPPAPVAVTTKLPVETRSAETISAIPTAPTMESAELSWAHWILPSLVMGTVFAMLVVSLVAHIQNKRFHRGL